MGQGVVRRKLVAIFYADVAGYSRLTGVDEEGTHRTLSASLDFIAQTIEERGGTVIHYAGDAVLADFASVMVAVESAVAIQHELAKRNREVEQTRRLLYRIGINLGDVIVDRGDIYGDGVNIAARLESLADPGGICVSAKVRDEVGHKLDLVFEDMGEQKVKNIAQPVRAYRLSPAPASRSARPRKNMPLTRRWAVAAAVFVLLAAAAVGLLWLEPWVPPDRVASRENMAFPLPDRPSIAVLPFDNLSSNPNHAYFADGITEDIITTLSRIRALFVIARNSTFVYKGKPVKVQRVAEDLGVRYVLEGSVQRASDKVRITAQLVDALTGKHLWAERYDRRIDDLFALQDEITHNIALALQIKLTEGEQARVWRESAGSIEAWNLLRQGTDLMYRFAKLENARAREFFAEAASMEPRSAVAHVLFGWTHWMDAQFGWSDSEERSVERALAAAKKARSLDDSVPDVHALLGALALIMGDGDAAVAAGEKAVDLNPNHATNTALLGMILHNSGRPGKAVARLKAAMRLSPYYPNWFLAELAWSYLKSGEPKEAADAFKRYLERGSESDPRSRVRMGLALALDKLGHEKQARAVVAKALVDSPNLTTSFFVLASPEKNHAATQDRAATLRRLGLPN